MAMQTAQTLTCRRFKNGKKIQFAIEHVAAICEAAEDGVAVIMLASGRGLKVRETFDEVHQPWLQSRQHRPV